MLILTQKASYSLSFPQYEFHHMVDILISLCSNYMYIQNNRYMAMNAPSVSVKCVQ